MRAIAACIVGVLIGGCASGDPAVSGYGVAATGNRDEDVTRAATYAVRAGDTLYSIAWRHDVDYRDVAKWNGLGLDYKLRVGQVLLLTPPPGGGAPQTPAAPLRNAPRVGAPIPLDTPAISPPAAGPAATPVPPRATARDAPAAPSVPAAPSAPVTSGSGKWVWPTERSSAPRPVPGGGILLFGRLGQDVRAAGAGRVVYTGSGIRGYGNLIIIKHADNLLSSYAHNREILVREGQDVGAGQVVARMGTGPHQVSALYFEIRVNGKPTDPLRYLPGAR